MVCVNLKSHWNRHEFTKCPSYALALNVCDGNSFKKSTKFTWKFAKIRESNNDREMLTAQMIAQCLMVGVKESKIITLCMRPYLEASKSVSKAWFLYSCRSRKKTHINERQQQALTLFDNNYTLIPIIFYLKKIFWSFCLSGIRDTNSKMTSFARRAVLYWIIFVLKNLNFLYYSRRRWVFSEKLQHVLSSESTSFFCMCFGEFLPYLI